MMEILYIITQIIFILFVTCFFISAYSDKKIEANSLANKLAINSIYLINIFLLFSFTNLDSIYLLGILLISSLFLVAKKKYQFNSNDKKQFLLILFLIFFISIPLANTLNLGWDAKFFWFLKTINFAQGQSIQNLNQIPAFDYPHLGSYIWSFFWKFPFNKYEYLGRIYYICFYIISIFSFFEIFKISNLHKIILILLTILITYSSELFSGNQEILIFSLILLAAKFSYIILESKINNNQKTKIIFILLLILNASSWIKMEGLFFASFILFGIFVLANIKNNQKLFLLIGVFLIILGRFVFYKIFGADLESFQFEKTFNSISINNIFSHIKIIIYYSAVYLTQLPVFILATLCFGYSVYIYKIDKIQLFVYLFAILNVLFIFAAFIFSMEDVEWQVKVGLKRVMFETSGFYLLTIAYLINKTANK